MPHKPDLAHLQVIPDNGLAEISILEYTVQMRDFLVPFGYVGTLK